MKIKVYRTIRQVLHRITSRHEYALITTRNVLKASRGSVLIRLVSSEGSSDKTYIYIGRNVFSRERFDKGECLTEIRKKYPLLGEDEVSFPNITELYDLAEDKVIEIDVKGNEQEEVNRKWICDYLQFKENEREAYLNDDFTSVRFTLSKIKGRTVRQADEAPVPVDVADFEVYDRMIDVLHETDKRQAYGDACSIEYSITSDGYEYRYYLTHFFSNHDWNIDPQNLLNICFSAELLSGSVSRDNVRFSHPSKITSRRSDGAEYMVEMIGMNNEDVSVKFRDGGTNEPSRSDASGARTYDNPVDLTMWIDLYYQEIRMA